ncbi:MAG: carbohydrate porin [Deltaproteobacteria bacterium]|nr:carbohydrate porin [Deltaproteobacteria bacterium]
MGRVGKTGLSLLLAFLGIIFQGINGFGYQINEQLSIGGVVAGVYQYQSITDAPDFENQGRGFLTFEPEVAYTPTDRDEVFAKFGIGAGDGLLANGRSPFIMAPWGGNVEDSYKNINGRNRDYLLTAWYKHTFTFNENHTLGLTAGIIDSTDYMDENAFANDEFTQFMNQALINGPNMFLPSYDLGAAFEWQMGRCSVKGVGMALGSNGEDGAFDSPYNFYGIQLGYQMDFGLGEGNYRLIVDTTSRDFIDVAGTGKERKVAALFSFDQQLGEILGAWLRLGQHSDKASVNYSNIYSGGLNISGRLWGREGDNVGIGCARLGGGNKDVDYTDVFEVYGRIAFSNIFGVTGDIQYMKDSMVVGDSPKGWIFGLRLTAEF